MAEQPETVVSDTTETTESSSADTQTEGQQTEETKERLDWRRVQREDADLNAHVQSEIARARTRWQRQQLREAAKHAATAEDPAPARQIAQQVAAEEDELDEGEAEYHEWSTKQDAAAPLLNRLFRLDSSGRATNPDYVALHQRVGEAEMNKRYAADPEAFYDWAQEQIVDMRADAKAKGATPAMAAAMSQDAAHQRLRGMPTPLGGSASAGGALTLEAYHNMTFDERQELRKKNPRAIDDMIARAQR